MIVYLLSDPRTNEPRYVGQSVNGIKRAKEHWRNSVVKKDRNFHKKYWILQLKKENLRYNIDILEKCNNIQALDDAEKYWISYFRFIGAKLVNLSEGGAGERPLSGRNIKVRTQISKSLGGRAIQDERGNVYYSKNEAARKLDIKHQAITHVLQGKSRHAKGHTFSYVGDPVPKQWDVINDHRRTPCSVEKGIKIARGRGSLAIKDQFGNIYQTIVEAAKKIGCHDSSISNILNKKKKSVYGFTFIYINETEFQDLNRKPRPRGLVYNLKKRKSNLFFETCKDKG